jgi:outer membrane PBP1 activator LpoA protein
LCRRGVASHISEVAAAEEIIDYLPSSGKHLAAQEELEEQAPTVKTLAKRAKIDAVWQALNSRDTGGINASGASGAPSSHISLAALCGRVKATAAESPELVSELADGKDKMTQNRYFLTLDYYSCNCSCKYY